MKSLYLFLLSFLLAGISVTAQDVPLGAWKDYLSYQSGVTVTMGQNAVYCVAGSGVFSYNLSDNSIEKLNKVTGLSDVGPTIARYGVTTNTLVIGYSNGNMDILHNKTIINIPDLKNSSLQGSKAINCVYFPPGTNYALVGCGQGIMQIDLTQNVILNTYFFGPLGSAINVRGITMSGNDINSDTIFAATDNGIYKASFNDPNLNNYNDWLRISSPTIPSGVYNTIVSIGDSLYTNRSWLYTKGAQGGDTVFVYSKGHWGPYIFNGSLGHTLEGGTTVYSLESSQVGSKNILVASIQYFLFTIDPSTNNLYNWGRTGSYNFASGPGNITANDGILDASGNAWIADGVFGLVKTNGYNGTVFTPQGPYSNQVFNMAIRNNDLWVVSGAYDANFTETYNFTGASVLENGNWKYIPVPHVSDLVCIAIDPWKPLHAFVGSWVEGLVEFNNNNIVNVWKDSNTKFSIQVVSDYPDHYRIGSAAYDTLGNLWVTSASAVSKYLAVEKPNLSWEAFDFGSSIPQGSTVNSVFVTQSQAKWMIFNGPPNPVGILAYQDGGSFATPTSSNTQLITATAGNGGLPDLNVTCMAEDQNGSIWVGTDQRVVVFYSPDNVFDGNHDWDAQPVYVTQNGYTQYLMQNQLTTAIAIDGANRKWIGTQGGGVFLMSADGTQQIYNFTSSNSPLLSNNIVSIVINKNNGEVFFATDKGIVSFRGSATEGLTSFGNVYAYPDPVPHDYSGPIAIKNLVTNADVRITTINGELVYHTIALGGQAIWNGTNFDGRRVQTGVYLVFCASPDGSQ
ncbi:MAG TPA: two-component regulator propeller domain-containing protein, partial [Bacteroidia bacterium]|nr:two-component regulator propeller domain-containing protein [Bacteroidia bacterium]